MALRCYLPGLFTPPTSLRSATSPLLRNREDLGAPLPILPVPAGHGEVAARRAGGGVILPVPKGHGEVAGRSEVGGVILSAAKSGQARKSMRMRTIAMVMRLT